MSDKFDEIRKQIHEIRNLSAPFGLELANLKEQMAHERALIEEKLAQIEATIFNNSFKIGDLLERVKRIESALKIAQNSELKTPVPVHEDKESPVILPPQKPGP
jgi:uncharacterized protein YPO0396